MTVKDGPSDALFDILTATAVDGIIVINDRGIVEIYNQACERLFLYPPEEVIGKNVSLLMPEPYRREHDGYIERYKTTGERRIVGIGREVVGRRKDGTTFPMYLSVGEGRIGARRVFVGILHDLSEIKAAAAQHEKTLHELAAIVESSEDAILGKTLDGIVTNWNSGAERMFGYTAEEMIGNSISQIFPDGYMAEEKTIMERLRAGDKVRLYETVRRHKNGALIDVSLSVSPLHDGSGKINRVSVIARDITERKASEARLREMQAEMAHVSRLTSMGQLSSALAHELNQPLAATTNYVNAALALLKGVEDPKAARVVQALEKGAEQIQRAGQIIRRLRGFVEKRKASRALADINEVVREAITLGVMASSDVNVRLQTRLAAGLPQILIDRVQIQQVLVNLIRNAIEAMQNSAVKEITVSTAANESFIEVSVADTGPGIPPDVAERLFQPFVTTKSTGMGIGLMICRSILEAHGGNLALVPRRKPGAVFRFQLPIATESADDPK